jgi:haloacid dehalogenase-like hydrolase
VGLGAPLFLADEGRAPPLTVGLVKLFMNVLQAIYRSVRTAPELRPVVVFDLDSTLFSTRERSFAILTEAGETFAGLAPVVAMLDLYAIGWDYVAVLRDAGFTDENVLEQIRAFWRERFFASPYLAHDLPMPGATAYVKALHEAGAYICYLTGRDEPGMGAGTRDSLRANGFPLDGDGDGDRATLIMKADATQLDEEHKRLALDRVASMGEVVGAFDNEPELVNLLADRFPAARVALFDSIHSPTEVVAYPSIPKINSFEMEVE